MGDVHPPVGHRQRCALVVRDLRTLRRRDRAAQHHRAAGQVDTGKRVPRISGSATTKHQPGPGRSQQSRYPERVDIPARQVRTGHRPTQRHRPHHLPIARGQGVHGVVLGGRDHQVPDHQGLPEHRPVQLGPPPHAQRTADGRHLRGNTGPRDVVLIGRPIGRTDHGESSRSRPGTARLLRTQSFKNAS